MQSTDAARLTRHPTAYLARDHVFVAIDVETTGLNPTEEKVVEVAAVAFRGTGEVLEEFVTLLDAPGSPAEVRQIHRIDDEHLVGAPSLRQVWPGLLALLEGRVLVAHNLPFDLAFLEAERQRQGLAALPPLPGVCTLETARRHLLAKSYSMKSLHKSVSGAWRDTEHTALGDAHACKDVVLWLISTCPEPLWISAPSTDDRRHSAVNVPTLLRPDAAQRRPPPWADPALPPAPPDDRAPEQRQAEAAAKAVEWAHVWRQEELAEDPGPTRRRVPAAL